MDFLRPKGRVAQRIRSVYDPDPSSHSCINLASGGDYREGWVNVDLYADRADVRFNLESVPWPIPSQTYDFVVADQILEHLPDRIGSQDAVLAFLAETWRILRPGGKAYVGVPHLRDPDAWKNPTHRRGFIPSTLEQVDADHGDPTVLSQFGPRRFRVHTFVLRRLRWSRFFDSSYHIPKHFGRHVNVGRPWGIVWVLERRP